MRKMTTSGRLGAAIMVLALVGWSAKARAQMLLDLDFKMSGADPRWQIRHEYPEAITDWEAGRMTVRAGYLETARLTLPETVRWSRVTIRARAHQDMRWGVYYFDSDGRQLTHDFVDLLPASTEVIDHVFCFRNHPDAQSILLRIGDVRVVGQVIELESMRVEAVSDKEVLAWSEAVYSRIPPVLPLPQTVLPEPDFWDRLPKTKQAIEQGKPLRIVILGDSIASDTATGPFEVLLEAAHPGLRIDLATSTRSGSGSEYYRENDRVRHFVTRHNPDLVIIMGISQQKSMEAYADVIDQVRNQTKAEVLVMPGAVSRYSEFGSKKYDNQMAHLSQIAETARSHGAAWFNLRAVWETYLHQAGIDRQVLRRDAVHANALGRQVLARILSRILDPTAGSADAPTN